MVFIHSPPLCKERRQVHFYISSLETNLVIMITDSFSIFVFFFPFILWLLLCIYFFLAFMISLCMNLDKYSHISLFFIVFNIIVIVDSIHVQYFILLPFRSTWFSFLCYSTTYYKYLGVSGNFFSTNLLGVHAQQGNLWLKVQSSFYHHVKLLNRMVGLIHSSTNRIFV